MGEVLNKMKTAALVAGAALFVVACNNAKCVKSTRFAKSSSTDSVLASSVAVLGARSITRTLPRPKPRAAAAMASSSLAT